jgi:hypothetical protein
MSKLQRESELKSRMYEQEIDKLKKENAALVQAA